MECNIPIGYGHRGEEADPRPGEPRPHRRGQRQILQQQCEEVALEDDLARCERKTEQHIKDGGFPLDVVVVLQPQRCAAENGDDGERQPVDGGYFAAPAEVGQLHDRRRDRDSRRDVDALPLEGDKK